MILLSKIFNFTIFRWGKYYYIYLFSTSSILLFCQIHLVIHETIIICLIRSNTKIFKRGSSKLHYRSNINFIVPTSISPTTFVVNIIAFLCFPPLPFFVFCLFVKFTRLSTERLSACVMLCLLSICIWRYEKGSVD